MKKVNLRKWYLWVSLIIINAGLFISYNRNLGEIGTGNSAEFWDYACEIRTKDFTGHMSFNYGGGIYPKVRNNYYYFTQMHHEQLLFKITESQILKNFEEVSSLINQEIPSFKERESQLKQFKNKLVKEDPRNKYRIGEIFEDAQEKFEDKRTACKEVLLEWNNNPKAFVENLVLELNKRPAFWDNSKDLNLRIENSSEHWQTYVFEFLFLNCLAIFLFWPGLINGSPKQCGIHAGISVVTLFLPYFFGYSDLFTFGPTGAIMYPLPATIVGFPLSLTNFITPLDRLLYPYLPNLLGSLSLNYGGYASKSYSGGIGIVGVIIYGAILGFLVYLITHNRLKKN